MNNEIAVIFGGPSPEHDISILTAELAAMEALENNPHLGGQDRVYLQFALGKAYEDRKDYAQSFAHYAKGNAIKKAQLQYRAEGTTKECDEQIAACTPEIFARKTGCQAPDPIFILGAGHALNSPWPLSLENLGDC